MTTMTEALYELATRDGIDVDDAVAITGQPKRSYLRRWLTRKQRLDVWWALTKNEEEHR